MPKVYVGVTSYTGQIDVACCASILANIRTLDRCGYGCELNFEINDCYISNARNKLADKFLKSDADYFIFVDSDLSFDADAMKKLVEADRDVSGAAYPFKMGEEGYPVNIFTNDDGTPRVDASGLIMARFLPTGLMCIKRSTFDLLKKNHPEWTCTFGYHLYFDTGKVFSDDDKWYGEDVAFCLRVRIDGMTIWLVPDINLDHIGRSYRSGNYHKFLMAQPKPEA